MIAVVTGPGAALAATPEMLILLLAWGAAGAGLWLRTVLPLDAAAEEAAAAAVIKYGMM